MAAASLLWASGGTAAAQPVDAQLDVGNYPTVPAPPLGLAGTPQAGARLEGQRIADFVVGPWEVDPTLTGQFSDGAVVVDGPAALQTELPPELAEAVARHDVIDGFSTNRESPTKDLHNMVLRFADAPTASAAAADIAAATPQMQDVDGPITAVAVPGHPETFAFSNPADDEKFGAVNFVRAATAHGPYVLYQRVISPSVDEASVVIAGTLDRQAPLIDQFVPTAPFLLAGLPIDPTGLLARTLPVPAADATAEWPGVYGRHGALHFQTDPVRSAPLFAETDMTNWASATTGVYESRDPASAQRIVDAFAAESVETGSSAAEPVTGLNGSRCLSVPPYDDTGEVTGYCLAAAGRYVVEASADTLADAQRQAAAQYVMLTQP